MYKTSRGLAIIYALAAIAGFISGLLRRRK
jgi:hypothetical protein